MHDGSLVPEAPAGPSEPVVLTPDATSAGGWRNTCLLTGAAGLGGMTDLSAGAPGMAGGGSLRTTLFTSPLPSPTLLVHFTAADPPSDFGAPAVPLLAGDRAPLAVDVVPLPGVASPFRDGSAARIGHLGPIEAASVHAVEDRDSQGAEGRVPRFRGRGPRDFRSRRLRRHGGRAPRRGAGG
jgi:hypothetical protein